MGCLAQTVGLKDIADVDAFVSVAVRRTGLHLTASQREELEAEGISILYGQLEAEWNGRDSFAGFASDRLRRRLISAWHELNGHARPSFDGKRVWVDPFCSLDAELERPGFSEHNLKRLTEFARVPIAA